MFKEIPLQDRILLLLNSLGAHEPKKAVSLNDLAIAMGENVSTINSAICSLIEAGYVKKENDHFYITDKGIIRVMRSFS